MKKLICVSLSLLIAACAYAQTPPSGSSTLDQKTRKTEFSLGDLFYIGGQDEADYAMNWQTLRAIVHDDPWTTDLDLNDEDIDNAGDVDAATVSVGSSVNFEGATVNDFELIFTPQDAEGADTNITLQTGVSGSYIPFVGSGETGDGLELVVSGSKLSIRSTGDPAGTATGEVEYTGTAPADNDVPRMDGVSGNTIQKSGCNIDDNGFITCAGFISTGTGAMTNTAAEGSDACINLAADEGDDAADSITICSRASDNKLVVSADTVFGGTLRPTGYKSADGTTGVTVTTCSSFKNGLCVSGT